MDDLHLTLLRQMAEWAHRHGERVALDHSVLTALLDEIDRLRLRPVPTIDIPTALEVVVDLPAFDLTDANTDEAPVRMRDTEATDGLSCPECGKGGYKDGRGLGSHMWAAHQIRMRDVKAEE